MPKSFVGTPSAIKKMLLRKKHPIGTPALPIAASVARIIQNPNSHIENVTPCMDETNKTVERMKAAQPFMLMDVQSGRENCAIFGLIPN